MLSSDTSCHSKCNGLNELTNEFQNSIASTCVSILNAYLDLFSLKKNAVFVIFQIHTTAVFDFERID